MGHFGVEMNFKKMMSKVGDWIRLTQDANQWRAFVNTPVNLQIT
jgi:hypothetical protein